MKRFAFTLVVAALAAAFGPTGSGTMPQANTLAAQQQTAVTGAAQSR
jgi:hypothetical protein